jgi:hypothetical protein
MMSWHFAFLLAAAAAVGAGCLVPNRWLPPLPNDKLLHGGAFGGLAALALPLAHDRWQGAAVLGGVLLASLGIECLQELVPDRAFCWRDMAANAAGVALAGLAGLAWSALQWKI